MVPKILEVLLLLLLLLLLPPGNSDKPGRWDELQAQEITPGSRRHVVHSEEEHRLEGETFSVSCSYNPQEHENRFMNWCKKISNGESCWISCLLASSKFSLLGKDYFYSFDSKRNIFTITMYELKINDSGVYECKILTPPKEVPDILRRFHLVVSPVQSQRPVKPTSEVTSDSQVPNSSSNKFIILGVVFSCLLLLVFLVVGIICFKNIYKKARKGDDSEKQGEKSKGSTMKMESEMNADNIHYATVSTKNRRALNNAKIHIPAEDIEYATIK
ncbi:uncharacterized protein LOC141489206 [Macrotis lagotis]|uniref:uncharacterized protein LOC141489206 n=1 Tax=Macrotis lagotis TaxID=92651 RepID=UPI003D69376C